MTSPLEMSGVAWQQLVDVAATLLRDHLDSLPDQPAWNQDEREEVANSMIDPLPEAGGEFRQLLQRVLEATHCTYNTASPGYLAYIPAGGLPTTAIADLISNVINRYVSVWTAAPGLAQLETTVVRWFLQMMGLESGSGFLTTGGSLANWSALVVARQCRLRGPLENACIYTSNQAHHSIQKAAVLAGFRHERVHVLSAGHDFRIDARQLAEQIAHDRQRGLEPLAIVGHGGTVNTGAVDPLEDLAALATREKLWLHVDAAYGGFFNLTQRGAQALRGIEQADSITLDPHKSLFLPYGTGCLLVQRATDLKTTFGLSGDYMPDMQDHPDHIDYCEISPELSRDFRGLRVWLPIQLHGIAAFRDCLDEKLDLAAWLHQQLQSINVKSGDRLEIVAPPTLSILAFRLQRMGLDQADINTLNQHLRDRINERQTVFLTPTTLDGNYVIRVSILSFRTHRKHLEELLRCIDQALQLV